MEWSVDSGRRFLHFLLQPERIYLRVELELLLGLAAVAYVQVLEGALRERSGQLWVGLRVERAHKFGRAFVVWPVLGNWLEDVRGGFEVSLKFH